MQQVESPRDCDYWSALHGGHHSFSTAFHSDDPATENSDELHSQSGAMLRPRPRGGVSPTLFSGVTRCSGDDGAGGDLEHQQYDYITPLFPPEIVACDAEFGAHDDNNKRHRSDDDFDPPADDDTVPVALMGRRRDCCATVCHDEEEHGRQRVTGRRRRGRAPSATNIFIPTDTGKRLALDKAVDALVDSFLPLHSPELQQRCIEDGRNCTDDLLHSCLRSLDACDPADLLMNGNCDNSDTTANGANATKSHRVRHVSAPDAIQHMRRVQNSNSARRSRMRKHLRLQALEMAVRRLEARVEELEVENGGLRAKLAAASCYEPRGE